MTLSRIRPSGSRYVRGRGAQDPDQYHLCRFCTSASYPVRDYGASALNSLPIAAERPLRAKSKLLNRFNLIWVVQLSSQIYTSSLFTQISGYFRAVPSRQEGRIAIVTNARRDAVDARASARKVAAGRGKPVSGSHRAGRTALLRTAKPCGPGARGWRQAVGGEVDPTGSISHQAGSDGGKTNSSPGRARHKPSSHCAGNAGVLRLYLYARVRTSSCTLHTRPRVQQAPGIPCSLSFEGQGSCKPRAS